MRSGQRYVTNGAITVTNHGFGVLYLHQLCA